MKTVATIIVAFALALSSCATTNPNAQVPAPATTQETTSATPQTDAPESLPPESMPIEVSKDEATDNVEAEGLDGSSASESVENESVGDDSLEDESFGDESVGTEPLVEPGTLGKAGGIIFNHNGRNLEEFVLDTDGMGYEEALTIAQNCTLITKTAAYTGWRLPNVDELLAIYTQLFETGLVQFEEVYYWAQSTDDANTAPVVYFGTGFETEFYKDMDFVGLIVVREI